MKKFSINCDFGGQMAPFTIYIGQPEHGHHPLHFQADWLGKQRGGTIPPEVMDAIAKLKELADKNNVSLEELCVYALGSAQEGTDAENQDAEGQSSEEPIEHEPAAEMTETSESEETPTMLETATAEAPEPVIEETASLAEKKKPKKKKPAA